MNTFKLWLCTAVGLAAIAASCTSAWAGAWTLPKGQGQIISTYTYAAAERAFDSSRAAGAQVDFVKSDQALYIEYGLLDNVTLVGSGALQDIAYVSRDGPQAYSGFGVTRLGLRYGLPQAGPWTLSAQAGLVIPAGGESVPDADLGRGGLGADVRLMAGRNVSVMGRPAFFDSSAYFDYRSGGSPQQMGLDLTLGVDVHPRVQIITQSFAQYTTSGTFTDDKTLIDDVLENDSLRLQASAVLRFGKGAALQIGAFDTVWGRNTVRQSGGFISLWQTF